MGAPNALYAFILEISGPNLV